MTAGVNELALCAAGDENRLEELIRSQEQLILRTASGVSRRYIRKTDDEWSVALWAFARAVKSYRRDRGDFLPYAQTSIRHALTDHFRSELRRGQELAVAPHVLEGNGEPGEDRNGVYPAVVRASREMGTPELREEIQAATALLRDYGIRFLDLTRCSPRQDKTRRSCAAAIRCLRADPLLLQELQRSRRLPMKALAAVSGVPRKTLEQYRKYIITAALVLEGDFPGMAGYLKYAEGSDEACGR